MIKSGGSIYRVQARQTHQLKLYSQLEFLSKAERAFLLSLLELSSMREDMAVEGYIDISKPELQLFLKEKSIGAGDTIMKRRSNALEKLGVFKKSQYQREKCKPAHLFILSDVSDLIDIEVNNKTYKDHRPHKQNLKEIKTQLIEADAQILDTSNKQLRLARSERLWNAVFGSCMRTSRTDPRTTFSTVYKFASDTIEIITSSQTDSEICHVDDQRTIRAVITLVCLEIAERVRLAKEVKNDFYIDIVDLCSVMGLTGSGANRDTIRQSMKRLYSTNFNVILDSESDTGNIFAEQFGITPGADDLNFRFLTELDSSIDREHGGSAVRRPRWYRVALHSKTFQDLTDAGVISTYIDNKKILEVSSGLIHVFYSFCCVHVKRHGKRVVKKTLPELQRALVPASRYDNFRGRFITALKAYQKKSKSIWNDNTNIINLFGYLVTMQSDPIDDFVFTIRRDKKDPVIGDQSTHNKLLQSSETVLEI